MPILIAYDGSDDSKTAIEHAGALFNGATAVILTIWEPFAELISRTPATYGVGGITDFERIDKESSESARGTAEEGVALARAAGLDASAAIHPRSGPVARTVLDEADRLDADAIVMGSRGLGGLGSLLLGSVSHAVIQSADRAVLVVPSPAVAKSRFEKHHRDQ